MICTFGDITDVTWWRELQLPTRPIIGWDGRILPDTPDWITTDGGNVITDVQMQTFSLFSNHRGVISLDSLIVMLALLLTEPVPLRLPDTVNVPLPVLMVAFVAAVICPA